MKDKVKLDELIENTNRHRLSFSRSQEAVIRKLGDADLYYYLYRFDSQRRFEDQRESSEEYTQLLNLFEDDLFEEIGINEITVGQMCLALMDRYKEVTDGNLSYDNFMVDFHNFFRPVELMISRQGAQ